MTAKDPKGPLRHLSDSHRRQLLDGYAILPEETRNRRAWCPYKFDLRDGKRTKVPYNPRTGRRAKSNNPKTWSSFEEAYQATLSGYDGVQYILSEEDPYFLLDLDGCRCPETGEITLVARRTIEPFVGKAFIEISTSGTGIHVFGRGKKPDAEWCRNSSLGIELYDWGRPVVFTGNVLEGSSSELADCQDELDRLYHQCMPEHLKSQPERERAPHTDPVNLPDEELLQKAANSKYGDEFRALWAGNTSPTNGDQSRADYSLMKALLFWTGGDERRAIELFGLSGLARREKWRRRADYRQSTARKARMALTSFYQGESSGKSSRSAQLEDAARDLWRRWWDFDWARLLGTGERPNSIRGHSCRDVMNVLIDAVAKHGYVSEDKVRVSLGRREIALRAATSLRTVHKTIKHLEAEGWLKFEPPKSEGEPGAYVMRATLHHNQNTQSGGGREEKGKCFKGGGEDLRVPRLRWSSPGRKAHRGVDKETRRVRDNIQPAVEGVKRLGKVRGAVVDVLVAAGGSATLVELCEILRRSRTRDLRRRILPMLEDAGILTVEGDMVTLTGDWLARLEDARVLGREPEREELEREDFRRQHEAFRSRHENPPDRHYANADADGHIEDLRPAELEPAQTPPSEPEVSELARAIREYLDRSPADACQPPGWIGVTLWAHDLYGGKPTPAEVRAALEELGGEPYLRSTLRRSEEAA